MDDAGTTRGRGSRPKATNGQGRTARLKAERTAPRLTTDGPTVDVEAAWKERLAPEPTGDLWTARPWVHPDQRRALGQTERKRVPRRSHAAFEAAPGRDPIAILEAQEADRLQELVPLRHARMAESAFAYYRGTPAVMAFDLSTTPRTDIIVQASGDCHISNFGLFASPERQLVFDANDFDETTLAPWEWDVKRLAASVVVAGRENGFPAEVNRAATMAAVRSYREWMARYAAMRLIEVWYSTITADSIRDAAETAIALAGFTRKSDITGARARLESIFAKARGRDALKAAASLTEIVDGKRVIRDQPPVLSHVDDPDLPALLAAAFEGYRATMSGHRREFLERFRFADFALKVVGVGSVGTRCFIVALEGRDENDPLILQAKEATTSVLEPYTLPSVFSNHGQRVVHGQQVMQATPDIFLGWTTGRIGHDYYFRQLWDMKGTVDIASLRPPGLAFYGGLCSWALARAHARSGDAVAISAYVGTSDTFDGAIADFAEAYADQNERDFKAFREAIASGRLSAAETVGG